MLRLGKWQLVQMALGGALLCGALLGTAESKKKPKPAPPPPAAEEMAIEGIAGQLDAAACLAVLETNKAQLKKCYEDVSSRLRFLSGHVELKMFIGTDGKAKRIITQKSNLGAYEVEHCLVETLANISYPPAKGGLGEITYPMDFAAMIPSTPLSRDQASEQLDKEKKKLLGCASKAKKPKGNEKFAAIDAVKMTGYVAPGGQVASVGFSSPKEPLDEAVTACLDGKARGLRLPDPLGKIVKFEYSLGSADDGE